MLRLEDYSADIRRHLAAVFDFCGMTQPSEADWPDIAGAPRANSRDAGTGAGGRRALAGRGEKAEPMLPETRAALRAFYAPFNARLAALLGDARFTWADVA